MGVKSPFHKIKTYLMKLNWLQLFLFYNEDTNRSGNTGAYSTGTLQIINMRSSVISSKIRCKDRGKVNVEVHNHSYITQLWSWLNIKIQIYEIQSWLNKTFYQNKMWFQIFGQNCNIISLGRKESSDFVLSLAHYMELKHKHSSEIVMLCNSKCQKILFTYYMKKSKTHNPENTHWNISLQDKLQFSPAKIHNSQRFKVTSSVKPFD